MSLTAFYFSHRTCTCSRKIVIRQRRHFQFENSNAALLRKYSDTEHGVYSDKVKE